MPETQISFFQELSRRRVIRMLSVYMAASFVLLQVADVTFDPLGLPAWAIRGEIKYPAENSRNRQTYQQQHYDPAHGPGG